MADPQNVMPVKPSFVSSVMSGIGGYIRGAISGGIVGGMGGGLIGLAVGVVAAATGPGLLAAGAALAVSGTAATGALVGGSVLASIGAIAGAMTGVIKSREVGQPSADDVVNVAKIAFAQGVAVGHNVEHAAHHKETKNQDRVTGERMRLAMAERQVIN